MTIYYEGVKRDDTWGVTDTCVTDSNSGEYRMGG
jgi:hypothetical protein